MDDRQQETALPVDARLENVQDAENVAMRIAKLSEIEQNVTNLLRSAGLAVQALTVSPEAKFDGAGQSRKDAFTKHTREYFEAVSFVDVNLRRQIYALEEAGIIPATKANRESASFPSSKDSGPSQSSQETAIPSTQDTGFSTSSTRSGLGGLDIGWLNSQRDLVGKQKELELWKEAERLISQTLKNFEERDAQDNVKDESIKSTPSRMD